VNSKAPEINIPRLIDIRIKNHKSLPCATNSHHSLKANFPGQVSAEGAAKLLRMQFAGGVEVREVVHAATTEP
jgi:hypothetical protein